MAGRLKMGAALLCALSLVSLTFSAAIGAFGQSEPDHYFLETGHLVKGRLLEYWTENGGLRQFGYPISDTLDGISASDGRTYTVQYFENAVMESHPDNNRPYDVLLRRIGVEQLKRRYPFEIPQEIPNTSPDSISFPQTGKRLGGSFLRYWSMYGGLAQFGYPITDEMVNSIDPNGLYYTLQYFERAVMEWHPGTTPPGDVVLGHIGTLSYQARYGQVLPRSGPTPTPDAISPRFIEADIRNGVTAFDHELFYLKGSQDNEAVYGYDLNENRETVIANTVGTKSELVTDGKYLVWKQIYAPTFQEIRAYDLTTQKEFSVLSANIEASGGDTIALDAGVLYYTDNTEEHQGLYAHTIASGEEHRISSRGGQPVASDGVLVWTEPEEIIKRDYVDHKSALYMRKAGDTTNTLITDQLYNSPAFATSGGRVAWAERNTDGWRIHVYDVATGTDQALRYAFSGYGPPVITGSDIIWAPSPSGGCVVHCGPGPFYSEIRHYSFVTGLIYLVIGHSDTWVEPAAILSQKGQKMAAYIQYDINYNAPSLFITPLQP